MNRLSAASTAQQQIRDMIEAQPRKTPRKGKKGSTKPYRVEPPPELIAQAHLPTQQEFADIFQKFKLTLNLLVCL